jgi:hypothetical protein
LFITVFAAVAGLVETTLGRALSISMTPFFCPITADMDVKAKAIISKDVLAGNKSIADASFFSW